MDEKPEKSNRKQRGFVKGQSGNPAGRPKGVPNKATQAVKEVAANMLDEAWQKQAKERVAAGKAPHLETLFCHYLWGKPTDKLELTGNVTVRREAVLRLLADPERAAQLDAINGQFLQLIGSGER